MIGKLLKEKYILKIRMIRFEVNLIWPLSYRNTTDLFHQHLLLVSGFFAIEALNYSIISQTKISVLMLSIFYRDCFEEYCPNFLYLSFQNE